MSSSTGAPGCLIGCHRYLRLLASHRLDPYEALNLRSVCSQQLHSNLGPCNSVACCSVPNPTEAQPESASDIRDAIKKHAIVESEHQRCYAADYFFIHDIHTQLGLPSKDVNQDNMSGYLTEINEKWKERWHEADWHKSYIWSIEGALTMLWQMVQSPDQDLSSSLKMNLENVIVQLEECQYRCTMLVASDLKGMVDPPRISPGCSLTTKGIP